jgi:predicted DNA-binding transcriptional regulator AlpA
MDRLLERLEDPRPLRVHEVAELTGYSLPTVRKLIEAGVLRTVVPESLIERRVPITEA